MHRIDGAGHVDHMFVAEDPATLRPPTEVTPGWLNAVQEELASIPEGAGLPLSGADDGQVIKALKRLFGGNVRTIAVAGPTVLTADDAGLVIVDASNNNVAITMPAVNAVANAPLLFEFVRVDMSGNTATISCAGGDALAGGATSFTLPAHGDYRSIVGDAGSSWVTTSVSPVTTTTDFKNSVRFTTTGNIILSGLGTQAGGDWTAPLTAGDRILPKDQAVSSQNGIYIAAAGAWTRATDADGVGELTPGALVAVEEGATLADSVWELATDGAIIIGTTALTFAKQGGSTFKQLYGGSVSVAANALTVSLDPCATDFRSTSLTSGSPVTVTNGAAISLTVPSGATLGTANGVQARLVVLEINNAGTKEVAIVNLAGGNNLDGTGLISTTAISAASNSANVVYSQTARANVAYQVKLFLDITEAAAGTWATAPTLVQPVGARTEIGLGQTWQDMTGSRASGTIYYNTTGKEIDVSATWVPGGNIAGYGQVQAVVIQNGVSVTVFRNNNYHATDGQYDFCPPFRVPPGAGYSITASGTVGTLNNWSEKR